MTQISPAANPAFVRPKDFGNAEQPDRNVRRRVHLIDDIKYHAGIKPEEYDDAPLVCTCGWSGRAGDYLAHRQKAGATKMKVVQG